MKRLDTGEGIRRDVMHTVQFIVNRAVQAGVLQAIRLHNGTTVIVRERSS